MSTHPDGMPITATPYSDDLNYYEIPLNEVEQLERRARLAEAQLAIALEVLDSLDDLNRWEYVPGYTSIVKALEEIKALKEGLK